MWIHKAICSVAYLCFGLAIMSLVKLADGTDLLEIIISISVALLLYQSGAGLLKGKGSSRILALIMLGVFFHSFSLTVYTAFVAPLTNPQVTVIGFRGWLALLSSIACGSAISILLRKDVKECFSS